MNDINLSATSLIGFCDKCGMDITQGEKFDNDGLCDYCITDREGENEN